MRSLLNEAHLEIACERMQTDVETFLKKTRHDVIRSGSQKGSSMRGCSIVKFCDTSGISPQAYYKVKQGRKRKAVNAELVVQEVKVKRRRHPRMGTRKLHHELRAIWEAVGIKIGRDIATDS